MMNLFWLIAMSAGLGSALGSGLGSGLGAAQDCVPTTIPQFVVDEIENFATWLTGGGPLGFPYLDPHPANRCPPKGLAFHVNVNLNSCKAFESSWYTVAYTIRLIVWITCYPSPTTGPLAFLKQIMISLAPWPEASSGPTSHEILCLLTNIATLVRFVLLAILGGIFFYVVVTRIAAAHTSYQQIILQGEVDDLKAWREQLSVPPPAHRIDLSSEAKKLK